jgi:hypothetical protein
MQFSSNPSGLLMVEYGMAFPGWGHQLTTLCYVLLHCQQNDLYPIIYSRPDSAYGAWEDTFLPFWNKHPLGSTSERFPKVNKSEAKLADWIGNREGFFGTQWQTLAPKIKNIFEQIYQIRPEVKILVNKRIESLNLPEKYISAHVRRGDKCNQFEQYGHMKTAEVVGDLLSEIGKYPADGLFVMTDDYEVIEVMSGLTKLKLFSLCSPDSTGDAKVIRNSKDHLLTLLTDIEIARRSTLHFQTVNTRVSKIVRLLKNDAGCKHIYNSQYTVDTHL